jgi:hypothetical protein
LHRPFRGSANFSPVPLLLLFSLRDSKPKHGLPVSSPCHLQDHLQPDQATALLCGVDLDAGTLRLPLRQAPPSHLSLAHTSRLAPLGLSLASHFGPRRLISTPTWSSTPSQPHLSSGRRCALSHQMPCSVIDIFTATLLTWTMPLPYPSVVNASASVASSSTPRHGHLHLQHLFLFLDDTMTLPHMLDLVVNASH